MDGQDGVAVGLRTPNTKVNNDIRPEAGVEGNACVTIRLHQVMATYLRVRLHREHRIAHTHTKRETYIMRSEFR